MIADDALLVWGIVGWVCTILAVLGWARDVRVRSRHRDAPSTRTDLDWTDGTSTLLRAEVCELENNLAELRRTLARMRGQPPEVAHARSLDRPDIDLHAPDGADAVFAGRRGVAAAGWR